LDRTAGLKDSGNWREIQEFDGQEVNFIQRVEDKGLVAGPLDKLVKILTKVLTWL